MDGITGDLSDGMHLTITSRFREPGKDVFISGGEKLSSIEMEEVLYRHPQVFEAAVWQLADEKWGVTLLLFVSDWK